MIYIGNLLLILGMCLGTIGASGFSDPPQDMSYGFFGFGMVLLVAGGLTVRRATRSSAAGAEHMAAAVGDLQMKIQAIAKRVDEIDQSKDSLEAEVFCEQIDQLLSGEYFELGAKNEEYQLLLGFSKYSKVWSGIAVCERLLSRAWSIATDGHYDEARKELPLAKAEILASVKAAESL